MTYLLPADDGNVANCLAEGRWKEAAQTETTTVCPYCGVGCALTLHVQDNRIVKVSSPVESSVTSGHLCVKGRFGFEYVQPKPGT